MKKAVFFETSMGTLGIAEREGALTNLYFSEREAGPDQANLEETPLLRQARHELMEYFDGRRRRFSLPLRPEGTEFEREVWAALLEIPYGEVRTYGQIAERIGRPRACRAVGRANGLNPISIIIPCHRVIGASGALTGYAGGLDLKRRLLELEKALPTGGGCDEK